VTARFEGVVARYICASLEADGEIDSYGSNLGGSPTLLCYLNGNMSHEQEKTEDETIGNPRQTKKVIIHERENLEWEVETTISETRENISWQKYDSRYRTTALFQPQTET